MKTVKKVAKGATKSRAQGGHRLLQISACQECRYLQLQWRSPLGTQFVCNRHGQKVIFRGERSERLEIPSWCPLPSM